MCVYVCMHVCIYVCIYVCICALKHACMYMCVCECIAIMYDVKMMCNGELCVHCAKRDLLPCTD